MKFKAILMDNDGTLMDFKRAEVNALESVLDMLGITQPDAFQVYNEINDRCWKDFEKGLITQEKLRIRRFRELMEHYGCDCGDTAVQNAAEAYVEALSRQRILLPGALDVVRRISQRLPVVILTNGISSVQHSRIDYSELAPYLSGLLISTEVGAPKPAPDMYMKALEMLGGLNPEDVLMIGDSLSSDIRGAINAGIPACWYNPDGHSRPDGMNIDFEISRMEQMVDVALCD